jgi:hypothetical protein
MLLVLHLQAFDKREKRPKVVAVGKLQEYFEKVHGQRCP